MTIMEAISQSDELKFNNYSQEVKIGWLSRLDHSIKAQILDNYEGKKTDFTGYDTDTDLDTVLLVPAPYDEIYLRWLEAQIDYYNGEYDKYNNAITMYNAAFDAFNKYYRKHHMPISTGRFLF